VDEKLELTPEEFLANLTKGVVKTDTNRDETVAAMKLCGD